jgi:ribosomal protein S18 acetylase RimI-like enzyme
MLTVSPELQGQGTGKLLLQAAEEKARSEGYRSVTINVITARHELVDWYKRKGFADTGERQRFPEDSKFGRSRIPLTFMVMQKPL